MKAVIADELGSLENFSLREVETPPCAPGQVLIRVEAAALGFADSLLCRGLYQVQPALPFTPGSEFSGVVDAVGEGVLGIRCGQPVTAIDLGGGMAEYAAVDAAAVNAIPQGLAPELACAFWADFTTAYYALANRGQLRAGETVLVLGAAGALGLAAVQVAKALGAYVIAVASSADKCEAAIHAGSDRAIRSLDSNWGRRLKGELAGREIDIVFDPVGGEATEAAFRRLAWGGRHLVLGFAAGSIPKLPVNLALLKGASLVGVDIRQFTTVFELDAAAVEREKIAELSSRGLLRPEVGASYELSEYRRALQACADRKRIGKTVVRIK